MYSHAGRTIAVERLTDDAPARAFLASVHDDPGTVDTRDRATAAAMIRAAFAEYRWRTADIIDTLIDAEEVYFDTVSQIRMDRWSTDRVALVGDAAYAPAFLSGQGTSTRATHSRPTSAGCTATSRRTKTSRCGPTRR